MKYLWGLIDLKDPYERLVYVCDSQKELSLYVGISQISISSAINHARQRGTRSKYIKIPITEEEWMECHEN